MIEREELIHIGRFNKTHGINGEITATTLIDTELLDSLRCLVSPIDGIYVPFFVTRRRDKGRESVILSIDDIDTNELAAELVNKDIFALKSDYDRLAQNNQDYDSDTLPVDYLIGFSVTDGESPVGTVTDVDDTTENVLLIVSRPDETIVRIPAADDLIDYVDTDNKILSMNLPEGLLEL